MLAGTMQAGQVGGGGGGGDEAVRPRELEALRGEMREGFRTIRDDLATLRSELGHTTRWLVGLLIGTTAAVLTAIGIATTVILRSVAAGP
jgi:hypothetical protein